VIVGSGSVAVVRAGRAEYTELTVPGPLQAAVRAVWTVRATGPGGWLHPVLPDGHCDLVVVGGGEVLAVGPSTRGGRHPVPAGTAVVGVRLWPGALVGLVDVRADELRDRMMPVGRLDCDPGAGPAVTALLRFLRPLAGEPSAAQQRVRRVCAALAGAGPAPSVRAVAEQVHLSERALRASFASHVGISPKSFHQITRMQRTLAVAAAGAVSGLAELAVRGGYADQAHLSRQLRALTGMAPRELLGYGAPPQRYTRTQSMCMVT
jgi:AraC-like DNA-binding protein